MMLLTYLHESAVEVKFLLNHIMFQMYNKITQANAEHRVPDDVDVYNRPNPQDLKSTLIPSGA